MEKTKGKMTKAELVSDILNETGIPQKNIQIIVDSLLGHMKTALNENRTIELRGFGTFEIRKRKGRQRARNPKTGEQVQVEDHGVVAFRPGKDLKKSVWSLG